MLWFSPVDQLKGKNLKKEAISIIKLNYEGGEMADDFVLFVKSVTVVLLLLIFLFFIQNHQ